MKTRHVKFATALCASLFIHTITLAQVTVMEKVPTLGELQTALKRAPVESHAGTQTLEPLKRKPRDRIIVWGDAQPSMATAPVKYETLPTARAGEVQPQRGQDARPGAAPSGSPAVAMPIAFEPNSSRVAQSSFAYIDSIARLLESDANLKLAIEGHTDAKGSYQKNLPLSWDRALSVYRVLVEQYGVDARRLQPVGMGSF
jgi:outer membrane protein OmpA-like peptidoglycan-associated protein